MNDGNNLQQAAASTEHSTLELVKYDVTAEAPERDHAIAAPERIKQWDAPEVINSDLSALQTAPDSGPEAYYSDLPPEAAISIEKNERTDSLVTPLLRRRSLRTIVAVVVATVVFIGVGLGLGLGYGLKTRSSSESTPTPMPSTVTGSHTFRKSVPMSVCKNGLCDDEDGSGCPTSVAGRGDGFPDCKVWETKNAMNTENFEAAEGGTFVSLDIFQPEEGCVVILKLGANTDEPGCGYTVGKFRNAVCHQIVLNETFGLQHCCGEDKCVAAGVDIATIPKMARGLKDRRQFGTEKKEIMRRDGRTVQLEHLGYPSREEVRDQTGASIVVVRRGDDEDCKTYVPDGKVYTRPADAPEILLGSVDGGGTGREVTITKERSVSWTTTFSAGINMEVISATTQITFEENLVDKKEKQWTVPASQVGKLGFTPTLKCTKGKLGCGDATYEGEVCTGFKEKVCTGYKDGVCTGFEQIDEIAGTYAVIAIS